LSALKVTVPVRERLDEATVIPAGHPADGTLPITDEQNEAIL
jgi:hypothetical protein